MSEIYNSPLTINSETGLADQIGLSDHKKGIVLARNNAHIAVKWPGGSRYHTIDSISSSYPPTIMVYEIQRSTTISQARRQDEKLFVKYLLDWDAGRKKKVQNPDQSPD